jgi:hypothetical protein
MLWCLGALVDGAHALTAPPPSPLPPPSFPLSPTQMWRSHTTNITAARLGWGGLCAAALIFVDTNHHGMMWIAALHATALLFFCLTALPACYHV